MQLKVGDIVKVRYLPGLRYIIRDIGPIFILLEGSDMLFWESEISLHEDQLKQNRRDSNLKSLLND